MDLTRARSNPRPGVPIPAATRTDTTEEHQAGRMEALAQALAVIGHVEGCFRVDANGDVGHPSFLMADVLRELTLTIRQEVGDPIARSALEVAARADEATELSAYVLEASASYGWSNEVVVQALTHVAGDIRKGTEGVNLLRCASDVETDPAVLCALVVDVDDDVRWWAAQNPSTPVSALVDALSEEKHPMVLAALLNNPHVPGEEALPFVQHHSPDVMRIAQRRASDLTNGEE